jgi:trehalose 6-phosphate synthase/phosphatase
MPRTADQTTARRVLIAANRLPITVRFDGSKFRVRSSDGGLAAALRGVAERWPVVWYGWDGQTSDAGYDPLPERVRSARRPTLVRVPMSEVEVEHFYRRFSNTVLWPALHGWSDFAPPSGIDWEIYRAINERYADLILAQLQPNDLVWVHDYHLLLLPALIRERAPRANIAFFLHTPFPEPHLLRAVPQAAALLSGMVAADVIGFHTDEYAGNFLEAMRAASRQVAGNMVRADGRWATVKVRPMGVDLERFEQLGADTRVLSESAKIRTIPASLMLGVDRLDYTKGIPQRLLALEYLLEKRPELRGRVTLLQIAVPTRSGVSAYDDLRQVVEGLVARINRRFATPSWLPVDYLYTAVDIQTLAALYRAADVMVVTPQRDGLNLVAKEFIATRVDGDGVLVLSKFAGAAVELSAALQVNPNHIGQLTRAYLRALTMPRQERRSRMRKLRATVASNTVYGWAAEFIEGIPALAADAVGA